MDNVESPALTQQDGTLLAMRVHWQAGSEGGAGPGQKIAVHVGQLFAGYPPGFLTELRTYLSAVWISQEVTQTAFSAAHAVDSKQHLDRTAGSMSRLQNVAAGPRSIDSTEASLRHDEGVGPSQSEENPKQLLESTALPPAWLTGGIALSASVLSLQLGVLSSPGTQAEAFLVSIERCSMHLGPYKPSARPGSLLSELFSLHKQALPGAGLRVALSGIQLSVATHWLHSVSRAGEAEAVLMAAGAEAVSEPIDLLALVTPVAAAVAAGTEPGRQEASDSWVASAAVSPVSMQLSGMQLAAVIAAAQGVQAEIKSGFAEPMQERTLTQPAQNDRQPITWLTGAAVHVQGLWLMHSPGGAVRHAAKLGAWQSDSRPASICHAETIAVSVQSSAAQSGMSVTVREPTIAVSPGLQLSIPAVELSIEDTPQPPAASESEGGLSNADAHKWQGPTTKVEIPAQAADGYPILYIHNIQTQVIFGSAQGDRLGNQVATTLESVSFGLCPSQLASLVRPF